ncbi:MAG: aminoacyl-tRNA hydrolase [Gemmatimonadota bacterium]|nr:aminoacyl-tRNA hydrolase [Gemmatimonadota bacterium]
MGNPGPKYAITRHNAGFLLADVLAEQWALPTFRRSGRALVSQKSLGGQQVVLMKPQTYMNLSGDAVASLLRSTNVEPSSELLVLVDDLALPLGTFRLRARGSAGGHNGLESVEEAIGSPEYARMRIGVGPLPDDVDDQSEFVLAPFEPQELSTLADLLPTLADAVECWLDDGIVVAMNRFNRRGTSE